MHDFELFAVFYFLGKDMAAKQKLGESNPNFCSVTGYEIFTYSSFLETFITLYRVSMGGYDVSILYHASRIQ